MKKMLLIVMTTVVVMCSVSYAYNDKNVSNKKVVPADSIPIHDTITTAPQL